MGKKSSRRDLLSDLPLGIIHIILSFVPIRDAVRTSLLSRQWRYIWASLPYLVFDEEFVNPPTESDEETEIDEERLIHFISQALLLHKGPIHKFQLCLPPMQESQFVDQWLLFLSRNDIRSLLLEYDYGDAWIDVPSSLYSCQNLTHLKLHVNTIFPPPPSFKGFLFLRSLDINAAEKDSSTIESIVAHSPLLENLTLDNDPSLDVTIRAPNLKYFHLKFLGDRLSLCTPLLEELIGYFSLIKSFQESSVFCHLRIIKLTYRPYNAKEVLPMVIHLIKGAPNLQQLEITCCNYYPKLDSASFWNMESAPHLTFDSLKVIKMEYFGDYIDDIKYIEFLLARSPVLEKMIIKRERNPPDLELMKLMAQLLKCPKASANAKIVIVDDRFSSSLKV